MFYESLKIKGKNKNKRRIKAEQENHKLGRFRKLQKYCKLPKLNKA